MKTTPLSCAYDPPADLLAGRVVLVTGAGRGLGRAVALACAASGATVALLGRNADRLTDTYDAIVAAGGREPAAIPLDLATAGDREFDTLAQLVVRDLGRLDALVHCAVHFKPLAPLADQSLEDWLASLRVNLAAPFALTRACVPFLARSPAGVDSAWATAASSSPMSNRICAARGSSGWRERYSLQVRRARSNSSRSRWVRPSAYSLSSMRCWASVQSAPAGNSRV